MLSYISRYTTQESLACGILGHVANVAADQLHGISAIAVEEAVAILRLRRRTINDSYEIICDDDAVLAFLSGVLGDEVLLDDNHVDIVLV